MRQKADFPSSRRQEGLVLLLAGLLTALLSLLALLLLQAARANAVGAAASASARAAALALSSGQAYAAARLAREAYPRHDAAVSGRGDDWHFREGTGLQTPGPWRNPSYSHGEHWEETNGDGAFQPNQDDVSNSADLDGDERFSAWSGRVRGAGGPFALRFSLAVESPEGKIPVNAGYLDAQDRNGGNMVPDHMDTGDIIDPMGQGPTWIPYHAALVHVLNNLGAILRPLPPPAGRVWTRRADVPAAGPEPIQTSWFGRDLIWNRPLGGYRDWDHLVEILTTRPGAPPNDADPARYTKEELELFRPYIDTGPHDPLDEMVRATDAIETRETAPYVPVNLSVAPLQVMQSLWMYLAVDPSPEGDSRIPAELLGDPFTGGLPPKQVPSSRAGGLPFRSISPMIWPDEAAFLAETVDTLRRTGSLSWANLYRKIADVSWLSVDASDVRAAGNYPVFLTAWTQTKTDLAFRTVAADLAAWDATGASGSAAWECWMDRDPITFGSQYFSGVVSPLKSIPYPPAWGTGYPLPSSPYSASKSPPLAPQGGTLAAPTLFEVAVLAEFRPTGGRREVFRASASGRLKACERLELSSQEDFELLDGGARLARRGLSAFQGAGDYLPHARRGYAVGSAPDPITGIQTERGIAFVATLPRWNRRAISGAPPPSYGVPPHFGFSRMYGAVGLSPLEAGPHDAVLYWPFKEDFDGTSNNGGVWTDGPLGDFWHEFGSSLPPPSFVPPGLPVTDWRYPNELVRLGGSENASPYGFRGDLSVTAANIPFKLNVLDGTIETFSMEAWLAANGVVELAPQFGGSGRIRMAAQRDTGGLQTIVEASLNWPPMPLISTLKVTGIVPDSAAAPRFTYHAILSVRFDETSGRTHLTLFLDGREIASVAWSGPPLIFDPANPLAFNVAKADEVRMYDRALTESEATARFALGRFHGGGPHTWRSPLYVAERAVRPALAQWTGVVPPVAGYDLTVRLKIFSDAAGTNLLAVVPLASGDVNDLSRLPAARSFCYEVDFAAPVPAYDTPVFESIWFSLQGNGRPRWLSWGGE